MKYYLSVLTLVLFFSCDKKKEIEFVEFTTSSDSTMYYYNLGMETDYGLWRLF